MFFSLFFFISNNENVKLNSSNVALGDNKENIKKESNLKEEKANIEIMPEILHISPFYLHAKGSDNVVVSYKSDQNPKTNEAFCKFDSFVVQGKVNENHEILCVSPPLSESTVKLTVSFDNKTWSRNEQIIGVQQNFSTKKVLFNIFACLFIFSGVPSCLRSHFCNTRNNTSEYDIFQNTEETPNKASNQPKGEQLFSQFA